MGQKSELEQEIDRWQQRRRLLRHPMGGMERQGFREQQIEAAERDCDRVIAGLARRLEEL